MGWQSLFLGVIALATLVMAILQVGAIVYAARLGRRVERMASQVQQDVSPLIARATAVAEEAAHVTSLATAQAERVDRLVGDIAHRIDETMSLVQTAVVTPAREGLALVAAVRAALAALRGVREGRARTARTEEEDALFIG